MVCCERRTEVGGSGRRGRIAALRTHNNIIYLYNIHTATSCAAHDLIRRLLQPVRFRGRCFYLFFLLLFVFLLYYYVNDSAVFDYARKCRYTRRNNIISPKLTSEFRGSTVVLLYRSDAAVAIKPRTVLRSAAAAASKVYYRSSSSH